MTIPELVVEFQNSKTKQIGLVVLILKIKNMDAKMMKKIINCILKDLERKPRDDKLEFLYTNLQLIKDKEESEFQRFKETQMPVREFFELERL